METKQKFEFSTGFSGDNIFQILLNDEYETGHQLTEKQYNIIYPEVRNILSNLMIHLQIDTKKSSVEITSIVDGMDSVYRRIELLSIDELGEKNNLIGATVLSLANFSLDEIRLVYRFCEKIIIEKMKDL